jgi:hypothetical protein
MKLTTQEMKEQTEQFFKDAFCAEGATMLTQGAIKNFKIIGVIEIQTMDERGVIHVGCLEKI